LSDVIRLPAWRPKNGPNHDAADRGTNSTDEASYADRAPNGHANGSADRNVGGPAVAPLRVLAIGAHPDDIELGCAGALIEHRERGHHVSMLVMSQGESGPQYEHSRVSEQQDAADVIGADLYWGGFDDAAITDGRCTVDVIQNVMTLVRPDVIYSHTPSDSHQDHRATALATLAAARRSTRVLQYEAPSSLGFSPALYIDIRTSLEGKLAALRAHVSQVLRNGLVDLEAIEAQARYRGFQARIRVAEAFEIERFVWDLGVGGNALDGAAAVRRPVLLEEVR
jgi:LmbE family N-acetylglucosaminyl deacetylase